MAQPSFRIYQNSLLVTLFVLVSNYAWGEYSPGYAGDPTPPKSSNVACENSEIVGLKVKAGIYVDRVTLMCARFSTRTTLGKAFEGPYAGGYNTAEGILVGVSSKVKTVFCPKNYVLSGLKMKGGDYVDRIMSLRCTRFKSTAVRYVDVGMGGNGGSVVRPYCTGSKGDRVTRLRVGAGRWMDTLEVTCDSQ